MLCDEEPIHDAFIGEPVEEALEMVRWALSHEDDEGFDAAQVLTNWAKKRGRGAWSSRPQRTAPGHDDEAEKLAVAVARMWVEQPQSLVQAIRALEIHRNGNGGA